VTDSAPPVLISYARFLECRERRLGIAAERIKVLPAAVPNDEHTHGAAHVPETDPVAGVEKK